MAAHRQKASKRKSQSQTVKRKISAQTRVKLSQVAKKRQRLKGKFLKGAHTYGVKKQTGSKTEDLGPRRGAGKQGNEELRGMKEAYQSNVQSNLPKSHQELVEDVSALQASRQVGGPQGRLPTVEERTVSSPLRKMPDSQRRRLIKGDDTSGAGGGTYEPATRKGTDKKGRTNKRFLSGKEYLQGASKMEQDAVGQLLADRTSVFRRGVDETKASTQRTPLGATVDRRVNQYARARQQGASMASALEQVGASHQGRRPGTVQGIYTERVQKEELGIGTREAGRKSPFQSVTPRESEFSIGIDIPRVSTVTELSKRFPNMNEREIVSLQQRQREYLHDEFLKNQKWAHETRKASLLGDTSKPDGPNQVTVFTTTVGVPNVKVPTDSILGQYVIRKRKRMMLDNKLAKRSDLQGRFPSAVRDQHVAEALTSRSFGAVGRSGMFKRGGWRIGKKTSKGFNQPMPVGAQIMYDTAGQPIYDEAGNIRFTQGATRPFEIGTKKSVGLGVYVG